MSRTAHVRPGGGDAAGARPWEGLRTLVRVRLLLATVALPLGVLMLPEAESRAGVLWGSLLAVGVLSAVYAVGVRVRRGARLQTALQLAGDLALVMVVAACTGGPASPFLMFDLLVCIAGGLLLGMPGGIGAAAGACATYAALPWVAAAFGAAPLEPPAVLPTPPLLVTLLAMVGVLSGVLGARVRRADENLARTERELDRVRVDNDVILRHLGTGVLTVDAWGTVAYLNPAAENVLGIRTLECRGRALAEALPERLEPLRALVTVTLERRVSRSREELTVRAADGRPLPLGISTNVLMHEDEPTGVVAVFSDLTEVREMERQARRHQTLAEIGALAATIAHELRNGLKPITGSIEFLQRELKPEGDSALLMELIARESARLNRFVTDLLGYSRERDLAREPLPADELLADFVDSLRHDPRRPAGVRVRLSPDDRGAGALLNGDREQLRQVWLNLAVNAFEAMPDGGELVVGWRWEGEQRVAVEFVDTGSGIAAADLPRIGEPFFTTKEGGTGLGLAIAHRIVERHGGTLVLTSEPGRGTKATVTLPGSAAALAAA